MQRIGIRGRARAAPTALVTACGSGHSEKGVTMTPSPRRRLLPSTLLCATLVLAVSVLWSPAVAAEAPALEPGPVVNPAAPPPEVEAIFQRTWARMDRPVTEGRVNRTWIWGPGNAVTDIVEIYGDAPNGERHVRYFDKTRMEDNSWRAEQPWDVTNGLLAQELVTGVVQLGDDAFSDPREPANVVVAGDPDSPGPTYATFAKLLNEPPHPIDQPIIHTITPEGVVGTDPSLAAQNVWTAALYDTRSPVHSVPNVFWEFMTGTGLIYEDGQYVIGPYFENPIYATGYPLTEPYWTQVNVRGVPTLVLVQVFERRVLTYTPSNPDGWKVEAGNVGQHYYMWRYGQQP